MDPEKRKRLEAAGWRFGDAADFLELTDDERQLVEARLRLSRGGGQSPAGQPIPSADAKPPTNRDAEPKAGQGPK